jgi:energy-coupling factor transport system ATP-binding protein
MIINFNNVSFSYNKNKKALKNINLHFDKSEIVFIMGHTGSGKSTLVQHLNGLLLSDEGSVDVSFDDKSFSLSKCNKEKKINELRREVGMVFQFSEYQLFETSVLKDVMFGPYNFFKDESKAENMAKDALNKMGIKEDYYEKSPFDLSGGEKRKVAIAGVLASNPSVLVLDEPTSSLDPVATKEMMDLVKTLNSEGKLIVVVSHDADLCYEYADRVIIMCDGEVVKDCRAEEAFDDKDVLNKASLTEPFVYKTKRVLGIKDDRIRNIEKLKEVISCE